MELAIRSYLMEPSGTLSAENWPPEFSIDDAAPLRAALTNILSTCLEFAA